ncbi:MAG TPA: DUF2231 domain-containing protein [Verrucomicrobiae bacterium]
MPVMPDPLHPAIIHFPVVLILLGTAVACAAVFWRKHFVPFLAAALLALGALGALAAVKTGKADVALAENLSPQAEALLDAHQEWAESTLMLAAIASVAAIASIALVRRPRLARAVAVVAALLAVTASFALYQTGHRGGNLVFRHGLGVTQAARPLSNLATTNTPAPPRHEMAEED